jgi:perosamine synthetase
MIKIPRGTINHKISDEILNLFKALFYKLNSEKIIEKFENKFANYNKNKFCCTFPFARTAFYYSIKSLDIKKGSEVIMSPITIKPILDVILDLGLVPIFCDLDANSLGYNEEELKKKVNKNTKLIVLTYLFGMVPNLNFYSQFRKNEIMLIEDFSQCLNGKFGDKQVGTIGDISIYSSSSIKTLDTYGGGIAVTDDQKLHSLLKEYQMKLHPASRIFLIKKILINLVRNIMTNYYVFNFITYYLLLIINLFFKDTKMLGSRSQDKIKSLPKTWFQKYTSFQALIGLRKLEYIKNEDKLRIKIAENIKNLSSSNLMYFPKNSHLSLNVYWQLLFYTNNRNKIRKYLFKKGIDTSSTSLEKICSLKNYGYNYNFPNVEKIYNKTLFFPCFSKMNQQQERKIYNIIKDFK